MKHPRSQIMQRKSALIAGILTGLASPGAFAHKVEYPRPQGSDLERLRGDMLRVGRDFSNVLNREYGEQKSAGEAASEAATKT